MRSALPARARSLPGLRGGTSQRYALGRPKSIGSLVGMAGTMRSLFHSPFASHQRTPAASVESRLNGRRDTKAPQMRGPRVRSWIAF